MVRRRRRHLADLVLQDRLSHLRSRLHHLRGRLNLLQSRPDRLQSRLQSRPNRLRSRLNHHLQGHLHHLRNENKTGGRKIEILIPYVFKSGLKKLSIKNKHNGDRKIVERLISAEISVTLFCSYRNR